MRLSLLVLGLLFLGITGALAGQPPSESSQSMLQQQYIGDVTQTVTEQGIPRGDLIKQLVLDIIEDIGYVKALLWLAMLPLAGILALVFGVLKFFKR